MILADADPLAHPEGQAPGLDCGETREAILDAANQVFLAKGFQSASLNEIAERAGFTKGAVYSNFAGKDDLFLEVWRTRIARRIAGFAAHGAQIPDPRGRLRALADGLARSVMTDAPWNLLIIEFLIHASRRPALRDRVAAIRAEQRQAIAGLLGSILPPCAGEVERRTAASLIAGLANGLSLEFLTEPDIVTQDLLRSSLDRLFPG